MHLRRRLYICILTTCPRQAGGGRRVPSLRWAVLQGVVWDLECKCRAQSTSSASCLAVASTDQGDLTRVVLVYPRTYHVNTANILFIMSGAFVDL
jgi:hypothetical protein